MASLAESGQGIGASDASQSKVQALEDLVARLLAENEDLRLEQGFMLESSKARECQRCLGLQELCVSMREELMKVKEKPVAAAGLPSAGSFNLGNALGDIFSGTVLGFGQLANKQMTNAHGTAGASVSSSTEPPHTPFMVRLAQCERDETSAERANKLRPVEVQAAVPRLWGEGNTPRNSFNSTKSGNAETRTSSTASTTGSAVKQDLESEHGNELGSQQLDAGRVSQWLGVGGGESGGYSYFDTGSLASGWFGSLHVDVVDERLERSMLLRDRSLEPNAVRVRLAHAEEQLADAAEDIKRLEKQLAVQSLAIAKAADEISRLRNTAGENLQEMAQSKSEGDRLRILVAELEAERLELKVQLQDALQAGANTERLQHKVITTEQDRDEQRKQRLAVEANLKNASAELSRLNADVLMLTQEVEEYTEKYQEACLKVEQLSERLDKEGDTTWQELEEIRQQMASCQKELAVTCRDLWSKSREETQTSKEIDLLRLHIEEKTAYLSEGVDEALKEVACLETLLKTDKERMLGVLEGIEKGVWALQEAEHEGASGIRGLREKVTKVEGELVSERQSGIMHQEKAKTLEQELAATRSQLQDIHCEVKRLRDDVQKLVQERSAGLSKLKDAKQEAASLQKHIQKLQQDHSAQLQDARQETVSLRKNLQNLEQEHVTQLQDAKQEAVNLRKDMQKLESEHATQLQEARQETAGLRKDMQKLKSEDVTQLQEARQEAVSLRKTMQKSEQEYDTQLQDAKQEVVCLRKNMQKLEAEHVTQLQEAKQEAVISLRKDLQELEQEHATQLHEAKQEVVSLRKNMQKFEQERDTQLEDAKQEAVSLRQDMEKLEQEHATQLQDAKQEAVSLRKDMQELEQEHATQLHETRQETVNLRKKMQKLQQEHTAGLAQLQDAKHELDRLREDELKLEKERVVGLSQLYEAQGEAVRQRKDMQKLQQEHSAQLQDARQDAIILRKDIQKLKSEHAAQLQAAKQEAVSVQKDMQKLESEHATQLQVARQEAASLRKDIQKLGHEHATQLEDAKQEAISLRKDMQELESKHVAQLQDAKQEAISLRKDMQELEQKYDTQLQDAMQEAVNLRKDMQELGSEYDTQLQDAKQEVVNIRKDMQELESEHDTQLQEARQEAVNLLRKMQTLQQVHAAELAQLQDVKNELDRLREDALKLEKERVVGLAQLYEAQGEAVRQRKDMQKLQQEIAIGQSQHQVVEREADKLRNDVNRLEQERDVGLAQLRDATGEIDRQRKEMRRLEKERATGLSHLQTAKGEIDRLQGNVLNLKQECASGHLHLQKVKSETDRLRDDVLKLEQERAAGLEMILDAKRDADSLRNDVLKLKAAILNQPEETEREMDRLRDDVLKVEQERAAGVSLLQNASSEVDRLRLLVAKLFAEGLKLKAQMNGTLKAGTDSEHSRQHLWSSESDSDEECEQFMALEANLTHARTELVRTNTEVISRIQKHREVEIELSHVKQEHSLCQEQLAATCQELEDIKQNLLCYQKELATTCRELWTKSREQTMAAEKIDLLRSNLEGRTTYLGAGLDEALQEVVTLAVWLSGNRTKMLNVLARVGEELQVLLAAKQGTDIEIRSMREKVSKLESELLLVQERAEAEIMDLEEAKTLEHCVLIESLKHQLLESSGQTSPQKTDFVAAKGGEDHSELDREREVQKRERERAGGGMRVREGEIGRVSSRLRQGWTTLLREKDCLILRLEGRLSKCQEEIKRLHERSQHATYALEHADELRESVLEEERQAADARTLELCADVARRDAELDVREVNLQEREECVTARERIIEVKEGELARDWNIRLGPGSSIAGWDGDRTAEWQSYSGLGWSDACVQTEPDGIVRLVDALEEGMRSRKQLSAALAEARIRESNRPESQYHQAARSVCSDLDRVSIHTTP